MTLRRRRPRTRTPSSPWRLWAGWRPPSSASPSSHKHDLGARVAAGWRLSSHGIAVTLFVFDVVAVEGLPTTQLPYSQRRELLDERASGRSNARRLDDSKTLRRL